MTDFELMEIIAKGLESMGCDVFCYTGLDLDFFLDGEAWHVSLAKIKMGGVDL